ncbi:SDR family oxidoreductase [Nocardia tengchongensis]|uniref:SDR family oxidoreductase n=1 Tax=Nocardia tengchongensis TaxID=2055889 RepID=UPI0036B6AD69
MHFITGATGNVGRQLVERLHARGAGVRALTRNPAAAALPAGVDVVAARDGSFPLDGVGAVFLNPAVVHDTVDTLLGQAIDAGVRRIVLLSSSSVLDDHPANHTGVAHRALEDRIRRTGMEWTFLRAGMFAANTRQWVASIRAGDTIRAAHTAARIAPIHEADLAAAATRALLTDSLLGTAPVLTGPDLLTQTDQAELIGAAIGATVHLEQVDPDIARKLMVEQHIPPNVAESLLRYYERTLTHPIQPTPISPETADEHPRSFREWVHDHTADFR